MKIWSSEHTFEDPWELVVRAQWRKYPNKYNQAVEGVDVVDRKIDRNGILYSHRLMSTRWGIPDWATKILGAGGHCYASEISWVQPLSRYMMIKSKNILGSEGLGYASEHSEVDAQGKRMEMKTRNLSFCNVISIDEKLVYTPHPEDKHKTLLKQEAQITVKGVPLCSYLEHYVADSIGKNATKGRQAMQYVIDKIKTETIDLSGAALHTMEAFKHLHINDHLKMNEHFNERGTSV